MSSFNLRWVEDQQSQAGRGHPTDLIDSVTIIVGVSQTIENNWSQLSDAERQDLAKMLRRRVEHLVTALADYGVFAT